MGTFSVRHFLIDQTAFDMKGKNSKTTLFFVTSRLRLIIKISFVPCFGDFTRASMNDAMVKT